MDNKQVMLRPGMHIHLVGIGGAGISAIAAVLLQQGYHVSGSDIGMNKLIADLQLAGATIYQGHDAAHIAGSELVVISSAIPADNPELVAAGRANIPVLKRAEFLGPLTADYLTIAVAGTHGKTTTTAMIAHILLEAGFDPSLIVGGVVPALGGNSRVGQGDLFVIEADEYDYMFLGLRPQIAVINNIDHDHPDIFPTAENYRDAFRQFARLVPAGGRLVVCADDPGVTKLLHETDFPGLTVVTYGLGGKPGRGAITHFAAVDLRSNQLGGHDFVVLENGRTIGLARLRVPGSHNVSNALAAISVATEFGVSFGPICQALASFGGAGRRFQLMGESGGVTVIDDYAHHPTEIRVNLAAARQRYPGRRLWAVWQPHTYSRTKVLLNEFARSFDEADRVIALDIYRSRERDTLGISTQDVIAQMNHPYARHVGRREEAVTYILDRIRPGDVILTLGAGDGDMVGQLILDGLKERQNN